MCPCRSPPHAQGGVQRGQGPPADSSFARQRGLSLEHRSGTERGSTRDQACQVSRTQCEHLYGMYLVREAYRTAEGLECANGPGLPREIIRSLCLHKPVPETPVMLAAVWPTDTCTPHRTRMQVFIHVSIQQAETLPCATDAAPRAQKAQMGLAPLACSGEAPRLQASHSTIKQHQAKDTQ
jgi:hypothetical protein